MATEEELADPNWRLSNLYWIIDKRGQRVQFVPNYAQKKYLEECSSSDLILKARQLGFTTLMCIIGLDEALFIDDHSVGIIAHTLDDANVIFETKVRYPYDQLPDELKERRTATNDRAGMLKFNNGSSIRVATSARSGTLQRLHVSEFGKICAQYPKKAKEIVTGSFPAVGKNAKTLESTAEGQEGYFYQYAQEAMRGAGQFKFHFFPWWRDPTYVANPDHVVFTPEDEEYFAKLEYESGVRLSPQQRAWWIEQEQLLGGDMKRENPATPEEAFEQAIEGAYFATQLAHADKHGHIGKYPYDPRYPVNTFWDLGRNDMTTIWFHQSVNGRDRFFKYYENSGEHISHYARVLRDVQGRFECQWGDHYWPHDGDRDDLFLTDGRLAEAEKHDVGNGQKLKPVIVKRPKNKMEAIEAGRARMANCDFDESGAAQGIKRLRHFRKEWDETREVWKDRPRHDENSHGADGYLTFATGYQGERSSIPKRKRGSAWAV